MNSEEKLREVQSIMRSMVSLRRPLTIDSLRIACDHDTRWGLENIIVEIANVVGFGDRQ